MRPTLFTMYMQESSKTHLNKTNLQITSKKIKQHKSRERDKNHSLAQSVTWLQRSRLLYTHHVGARLSDRHHWGKVKPAQLIQATNLIGQHFCLHQVHVWPDEDPCGIKTLIKSVVWSRRAGFMFLQTVCYIIIPLIPATADWFCWSTSAHSLMTPCHHGDCRQ